MNMVHCECGESYWMNSKGWKASCDKCGRELQSLTANKADVTKFQCSDGVIKPCPFCGAVPVPHGKDEYKLYHDAKCFLAAVYEDAGWLYGERSIEQWQQRAL